MKTNLHFECSCFYCQKAKPLTPTAFGLLCRECMETIETDLKESVAMIEKGITAFKAIKEEVF